MTDIDLIARLETAPEGSRELDAEIAVLVAFPNLRPARPDDFDGKFTTYGPGYIKCENGFLMADRYTTSLDATIPGEDIRSVFWTDGNWYAAAYTGEIGRGHTEALARRIAALRARQQNT